MGNNAIPHGSDGYSVFPPFLLGFYPLQKTGYCKACDAEKVVANVYRVKTRLDSELLGWLRLRFKLNRD